MKITLTLPDAAYEEMVSAGRRIQGTIGLVNPTEGTFHRHAKYTPPAGTRYKRLPHGRATVSPTHVRLTLSVGLDEADTTPSGALVAESRQAAVFVEGKLSDA